MPAGPGARAGRDVVAALCKDLGLRPDRTVVYICGNPEMILNVESELMHRGFPEFHVKKELYWPKGKDAGAVGRRLIVADPPRSGSGPARPGAR